MLFLSWNSLITWVNISHILRKWGVGNFIAHKKLCAMFPGVFAKILFKDRDNYAVIAWFLNLLISCLKFLDQSFLIQGE